ncbi:Orn/Lys/Arg decarboxylase N-terminal domain-containing protein [Saccharothrix longispora]|uniref:Arginine decarboxylase n=1 Tax=Saccharothrix longispora TaxID=33920 RepID=A0ABU1PX85_9PSEU|nr:Orn/Lys/Arg decarboxylase N-terminal domain-containing protein [Saccharothrix longispora]MDR6595263.1 arginine decarboxylase [Saccharothrix longispora]
MARSTVLIATERPGGDSAVPAAKVEQVRAWLHEAGHEVVLVHSASDAVSVVTAEADIAAAVISWELVGDECRSTGGVLRVLLDRFSTRLPVFLLTSGDYDADAPLWISEVVNGWIWLLEDTPDFIAGRIDFAARQYLDQVLPPFFRELRRFDDTHPYSWHTPAHAGGIAFLKSPVGRAFYEYYGERLFRTDVSVSVGELGSLFEHTGPVGDAERNAARVFGADVTYFVLHGTSTSNRMIVHGTVARDEVVLLDRNCHKAINHGVVLAGARPVYLVPTRNGYGITGPVPPGRLTADAVRARVDRTPIAAGGEPVYAVITNSTYDGLCYDAVRVADLLGESTRVLHFDEAWFAHARFHPLYARRYGMAVEDPESRLPTVFATHSSHKLLAALSQAAMIHVKSGGRAPFDRSRFDETYMMHGTTSPLYPMIASCDVAAGMMDGPAGRWLNTEAITEAVRFRQAVVRLGRRLADAGDRPPWFFGVWQPPEVADAPLDLLLSDPARWTLDPDADWHGFPDLDEGFCLLDPVKVTVTCPGVDARGNVAASGVPARVVTAYLETRRIVVEKTDVYTFLVLFSMGITKGKWGTLLDALTDFKHLHDHDAPLAEVLPDLVRAHPDRYAGTTLPQLCREVHERLVDGEVVALLNEAFTGAEPPTAAMTPAEAYQRFVRGETELVPLDGLAGRVVATQVTTTPPGIPVLVPGERVGASDSALVRYLRVLEDFDRRFPGFASETHGVRHEGGRYWICCVVER